jgi:hypothetical protein
MNSLASNSVLPESRTAAGMAIDSAPMLAKARKKTGVIVRSHVGAFVYRNANNFNAGGDGVLRVTRTGSKGETILAQFAMGMWYSAAKLNQEEPA